MEAEEKIDLFKREHNRLKDFGIQMQVNVQIKYVTKTSTNIMPLRLIRIFSLKYRIDT